MTVAPVWPFAGRPRKSHKAPAIYQTLLAWQYVERGNRTPTSEIFVSFAGALLTAAASGGAN